MNTSNMNPFSLMSLGVLEKFEPKKLNSKIKIGTIY